MAVAFLADAHALSRSCVNIFMLTLTRVPALDSLVCTHASRMEMATKSRLPW